MIYEQDNIPGKIHICVNGWTSPNVISYLGINMHWHENGKIKHIILDFIEFENNQCADLQSVNGLGFTG